MKSHREGHDAPHPDAPTLHADDEARAARYDIMRFSLATSPAAMASAPRPPTRRESGE